MRETGFDPWVGKFPWRSKWLPTPVFLPGKSHGRRSPVGYSPWGRKESDTTVRLHLTSLHFRPQWRGWVALWSESVSSCVCVTSFLVCSVARCVRLFATLWTVAHQVPLSGGFSKQDYWSGLSCLPPGDLLHPRFNQHLCRLLLCRLSLHCWATGLAMNTNVDFYQSPYALVDGNLLWVIPLMF